MQNAIWRVAEGNGTQDIALLAPGLSPHPTDTPSADTMPPMTWPERFRYSTHHLLWRCICVEGTVRNSIAATSRIGAIDGRVGRIG